MADDNSDRMQRIDVLLKQLDKVSKQAADLHRMATELSHEAGSSIRAAKSIKSDARDAGRGKAKRAIASKRTTRKRR